MYPVCDTRQQHQIDSSTKVEFLIESTVTKDETSACNAQDADPPL